MKRSKPTKARKADRFAGINLLNRARPYEEGEMAHEHLITLAAFERLRTGMGDEADTVCFLIPGTDRQGETVQSGLTSNSLESGGIKTWVVQPLPNAQELYGVFISQP